ncbi:hypothetical protein DFQ26_000478 [Actinomortierella ambigua]|nr:hypothetical protein DFQ26_000478 [Actinomortierella ambigua]
MATRESAPNVADMERGNNRDTTHNEQEPLLGRVNGDGQVRTKEGLKWRCIGYSLLAVVFGLFAWGCFIVFSRLINGGLGTPRHKHLQGFCDKVKPISGHEFGERQKRLSEVLLQHQADAYIAEPGANLLHLSDIHWTLSERPFLLVIQAKKDATNQVLTRVTVVAPAFEATRARQKLTPGTSIEIKTWEEAESPYAAVQEVLDSPWAGPDDQGPSKDNHPVEAQDNNKPPKDRPRRVFLDTDMRHFVAQGLTQQLSDDFTSTMTTPTATTTTTITIPTHVSIAPKAISLLRERKTPHEVEILRCVAQATVAVIQTVHSEIRIGMRESQVQQLLTRAYGSAGLDYQHGGSLVLFGPDAALPHGSGNDTELVDGMLILIDSGARLHGYISDITRTFWAANTRWGRGRGKQDQDKNDKLEKIWYLVKSAQMAALNATRPGVSPASLDKRARETIAAGGYGEYFTHRLGHGIGLEGHEPPYLNGGNTKEELKTGMTFTNEPGVYVEGQFGIRLEDMVIVTETGYELLSGHLAENPDRP